ncbi:hypothetical protein GCM10028868_38410 [Virgibacillus kimchii]
MISRKVTQNMNLIRRFTMGILSGNPTDEPMHYGGIQYLVIFIDNRGSYCGPPDVI